LPKPGRIGNAAEIAIATTLGPVPNRPRSQHYVPEFHLAQFVGLPFRRFHVFDKKWGKYGRPPVARSAFSRDYYLLPGETDEERLRLERQFALLEDQVAPLMKWLALRPPGPVQIGDHDRDALAGYAAILHIRVPAFREAAWERAQSMARDPEVLGLADATEFRTAARKMGMPGTDEDLEALRVAWLEDVRTGLRTIQVHRAASMTALTPAVEKVRPILFDRAWELLRVEGWPGFVIGDQPVTLLSRGRLAGQIGFGTPEVQVMMPLSPNTLLLISDRPRESVLEVKVQPWQLGLAEPWWATANRVSWLSSKRYVFAQERRHLQAAELLLHPDDRRRDITGLSLEAEAVMKERSRERRLSRNK
jgi:hypothetical protein